MELKLNVYKNGQIEKTYRANDFVLETGLCEDVLNAIDIDKLTSGELSNEKLGLEIVKIVAKSFSKFKPFLQNMFQGLTDDEYRRTSIKEVGKVVFQVVMFTISELQSVGNDSKN